MRFKLLGVLLLCLLLVPLPSLATSLSAQEPRDSENWDQFQAERKSVLTAGVLEAAVPVLGHAYADDAGRGVVPLAVSGGGLVVAIAGTTVGCDQEFQGTCIDEGSGAMMGLGLLAYVGGRIWGIVSAVNTAQDYNDDLRHQLDLSFRPSGHGGIEAALSYTTDF